MRQNLRTTAKNTSLQGPTESINKVTRLRFVLAGFVPSLRTIDGQSAHGRRLVISSDNLGGSGHEDSANHIRGGTVYRRRDFSCSVSDDVSGYSSARLHREQPKDRQRKK